MPRGLSDEEREEIEKVAMETGAYLEEISAWGDDSAALLLRGDSAVKSLVELNAVMRSAGYRDLVEISGERYDSRTFVRFDYE